MNKNILLFSVFFIATKALAAADYPVAATPYDYATPHGYPGYATGYDYATPFG